MSDSVSSKQTKSRITKFLQGLNRAWLTGRFGELERYLHEDVVMVQPGFDTELRGREACIKSYRGFMAHSKVEKYKETGHRVDSWEDVAVATYRFDITYWTKAKRYRDVGRDLFVLVRDRGRWRVVWRTLLPSISE